MKTVPLRSRNATPALLWPLGSAGERMTRGFTIVVALLAVLPAAGALAAPRTVQIGALDGVNADSLQRGEFLAAFHEVFAVSEFATEKRGPDGWLAGASFENRFRLVEGEPSADAWTLQVVVGLPPYLKTTRKELRTNDGGRSWHPEQVSKADPRRRAARGMSVAITVLPPRASRDESSPETERAAVAFPLPPPAAEEALTPIRRDFSRFPWSVAGRAAGVLALEALHRRSGELRESERFVLDGAVRAEARP